MPSSAKVRSAIDVALGTTIDPAGWIVQDFVQARWQYNTLRTQLDFMPEDQPRAALSYPPFVATLFC
jgi:hypothetical protein